MQKGTFIVIDGTDGSGKGTQTKLLIDRLEQEGYPVATTDFPQYGKKSAGAVEEYLNGKYGTADEVGAYRASIFFAVDRYDASFVMRQWLAEGKIIISNRYVTANMAHQGCKIIDKKKREDYFRWLKHLEYEIFEIPQPDINIILHCPAEVSARLIEKKGHRDYIGGKGKDIHEADITHLKNAEQVFLQLADLMDNTEVIPCMMREELQTIEQIHERLWRHIQQYLPKK